MWSERFVVDSTYKSHSYTNTYEVWIPVKWMTEPRDSDLYLIEKAAKDAFNTNPAWKVPRQMTSLRWVSGREFLRLAVNRYACRPDGHINETYVVFLETESMCD
jgi:hypothetical protein